MLNDLYVNQQSVTQHVDTMRNIDLSKNDQAHIHKSDKSMM